MNRRYRCTTCEEVFYFEVEKKGPTRIDHDCGGRAYIINYMSIFYIFGEKDDNGRKR